MVLEAGLRLDASSRLPSDTTNHPARLSERAAGILVSTVAGSADGIRVAKRRGRRARRHQPSTTARPPEAAGSRPYP